MRHFFYFLILTGILGGSCRRSPKVEKTQSDEIQQPLTSSDAKSRPTTDHVENVPDSGDEVMTRHKEQERERIQNRASEDPRSMIYISEEKLIEMGYSCTIYGCENPKRNLLALRRCMIKCGLPHVICKGCFKSHVKALVKENRDPNCPDCSEPIHEDDIRKNVDDRTANLVCEKREQIDLRNAGFRIRGCGVPGCLGKIDIDEAPCQCTVNREHIFCTLCDDMTRHPGQSHEEFDRTDRERNMSENERSIEADIAVGRVKRCPNCRTPIERSEGCKHMTCSLCRCKFCWTCLWMRPLDNPHHPDCRCALFNYRFN